jgi:transcriptional regulator with XRE-family HTH domain
MNAVLIGSAAAIALAARYGRRGRGLSGDIFDVVHTREQPSLLGPKFVRHAKRPLRPGSFTCEMLRDKLLRISLEVQTGRPLPSRHELQADLAKRLGVKPSAINMALGKRCKDERPLYESVSKKARSGFTAKESAGARARRADAIRTFTCDELEEVIRSTDDRRAKNLTKLLAAKKGVTIPVHRVQNALKPDARCKHLRELLPNPRRGRGYVSFPCEDLEQRILKYRRRKGAQRLIAKDLGVAPQTITNVLNGRCKHLRELLAG